MTSISHEYMQSFPISIFLLQIRVLSAVSLKLSPATNSPPPAYTQFETVSEIGLALKSDNGTFTDLQNRSRLLIIKHTDAVKSETNDTRGKPLQHDTPVAASNSNMTAA